MDRRCFSGAKGTTWANEMIFGMNHGTPTVELMQDI